MLSNHLKELESDGLITRTEYPQVIYDLECKFNLLLQTDCNKEKHRIQLHSSMRYFKVTRCLIVG